jgi:hypothetical protein
MKTTVDIADGILERAKRCARRQHRSLRDLIEESLDKVVASLENDPKPFVLRPVAFGGGGFQPGFGDADWDRVRDEIYGGQGS